MEETRLVRKVVYREMLGRVGFAIFDEDGELETFFPVKEHRVEGVDYPVSVTVSTSFFNTLNNLQDTGVYVQFDL